MRVAKFVLTFLLLFGSLAIAEPAAAHHRLRHGCSASNPLPPEPADVGAFALNFCGYRAKSDGLYQVFSNGDWSISVYKPDGTEILITESVNVAGFSLGAGTVPSADGDVVRVRLCSDFCNRTTGVISAGDTKLYPDKVFGAF